MNNFQNLKIAITPEQPLNEVVGELERLGYTEEYKTGHTPKSIKTLDCGVFQVLSIPLYEHTSLWSIRTTLAEIKEM